MSLHNKRSEMGIIMNDRNRDLFFNDDNEEVALITLNDEDGNEVDAALMAVFQIEDMAAGKVLGGMLAVPAVYWTYSVAKIAVAAAVSIGVGKIMSKIA